MKQLYTRWGKNLDPKNILPEHPNPLCRREHFTILNGTWHYAITDSASRPDRWDGEILVPFSPESLLSGVNRQLQPGQYLWYGRSLPKIGTHDVEMPERTAGEETGRYLLHFGAVDQRCEVYINGHAVGSHEGGYLPFTIDITDAMNQTGENLLTVRVQDDSDTSYHARGKQKLQRGGMYYTAQSGIWQTVWMEKVPADYIRNLTIFPDLDGKKVTLRAKTEGDRPLTVRIYPPCDHVSDREDNRETGENRSGALGRQEPLVCLEGRSNEDITISLDTVCPWTCETPFLYPLTVTLGYDGDRVESYFALRTFTVEKDEQDLPRICLNHKPLFLRGVLDQGYWSDGLYTAPSDDALIFDIASIKKLGYNMLRKHCKIEPQRWYYHCDRLGMIVWQDMVNGGSSYADWYVTYLGTAFSFLKIKPKDSHRRLLSRTDERGREEFVREMKETIRLLQFHPSIAAWVIFNEGWGQFETARITDLARQEDPTRLIDAASGWFDQGCGDFQSLHNYFFPMRIEPEEKRATVLSEYGGYSLIVPGHTTSEDLYGYGTYQDTASLKEAFDKRESEVRALIPQGLCASIYTQVSDIEDEVNGIFTYDREVQKLNG